MYCSWHGIQRHPVHRRSNGQPTGFKWTAHLAGGRIRTAQSFTRKAAIVDAERKIDRALKTISQKPRPRGENVLDLMDALKKSIASEAAAPKGKKSRKASAGQKEMLLPIEGKRGAEKKKAAKPERSTGRRKAG